MVRQTLAWGTRLRVFAGDERSVNSGLSISTVSIGPSTHRRVWVRQAARWDNTFIAMKFGWSRVFS